MEKSHNIQEAAESLLKDANIDVDAKTRNQASEIEKITTKKPKLAKNRTMVATAKVNTNPFIYNTQQIAK